MITIKLCFNMFNNNDTSGRFKSYRSGWVRIILRARSILMTCFSFGSSSCIIFAVLCCFCNLLHFRLHFCVFVIILCARSVLMFFSIFGSSSCIIFAVVRIALLLLHFRLHFCAFEIGLCARSILKTFFVFGSSSCIIFALVRSTLCISVCAMSRLNLVTFRFSVGCRCAIGPLGLSQNDVTSRRVMNWSTDCSSCAVSSYASNWCRCDREIVMAAVAQVQLLCHGSRVVKRTCQSRCRVSSFAFLGYRYLFNSIHILWIAIIM